MGGASSQPSGTIDTVMLAVTRYFTREPLGVATRLALAAVGRALGVHGIVVQDHLALEQPVIGCAWHASESPDPHVGRLLSALPKGRLDPGDGPPWQWRGLIDPQGQLVDPISSLGPVPSPVASSPPLRPQPGAIHTDTLGVRWMRMLAAPVSGDAGSVAQVVLARVGAPGDGQGAPSRDDVAVTDQDWGETDRRLLAFLAEMYAMALARSRERSGRIESEYRLDSLTRNLPGAVWRRLLLPDGRLQYTYLSSGVTYLTGLAPADAAADPSLLQSTIHPDDRAAVHDSIYLSARLLTDWTREFRILSKSGQVRWVHASGKVQRLPDGTVAWDGITLDVTDRRRSEQALRESEARFRSAFNEAAEGMALISPSGRWLRVNRSLATLLGAPPERIAGTSVVRWLTPRDRPVFHDMLQQASENGGPGLEGELRVLRGGAIRPLSAEWSDQDSKAGNGAGNGAKNGSGDGAGGGRGGPAPTHPPLDTEIWIHTKAAPVRGENGALLYWVAHVQDVSARRATEALLIRARDQAEATARAKSDFVAMMSHEIRTPLSGMIGLARLLQESVQTPEKVRHASRIESSARLLLSLLDDVLTLSKAEAGHGATASASFAPATVISEVLDLMTANATRKNLILAMDLDPALSPRLEGPMLALRQVLFNLVGNAVKFTPKGSVVVGARLMADRDGNAALNLSVTDTGPGVREEDRRRIFEPFSQGVMATPQEDDVERLPQRPEGVGLGLAICRRLVEEAGGQIGVETAPGGGALFRVTLPVRRVGPADEDVRGDGPHARDPELPEAPTRPPLSTQTPLSTRTSAGTKHDVKPDTALDRPLVFVVDDDEINREVMEAALTALGCIPRAFTSGTALLRAAQARPSSMPPPDLILMDLNMPDLDGAATTRQVRALGEAWSHVPVLAVTAVAACCPPETCRIAGMVDCLSKPVEATTLRAALARWVPKYGRHRVPPTSPPAGPRDPDRWASAMVPDDVTAIPLLDDALWARRVDLLGVPRLAARLNDLRDLGVAVRPGAPDEATQAHKLAGAAATLGATRLAAAARRLEQVLMANQTDAMVADIRTVLAVARDATLATLVGRVSKPDPPPFEPPPSPCPASPTDHVSKT